MLSNGFSDLKREEHPLGEDGLPEQRAVKQILVHPRVVHELQVGNRLGLLRLSRGEGYMDTCFISIDPQMLNHHMYTILDLQVQLSRLPARGRCSPVLQKKAVSLTHPRPGDTETYRTPNKGTILKLGFREVFLNDNWGTINLPLASYCCVSYTFYSPCFVMGKTWAIK